MKKLLLTFFISALSVGFQAQTATDFTANDCNSVSHNLFNELNSGKVVIITWVMPCSGCSAACGVAWNVANSYSLSNPGQVVSYIADDFGTTSCQTLSNWMFADGLSANAVFTNSLINMADYGASGMPKLVVLAAATHSVYYNENNNNINSNDVQAAVALALGSMTAIKENSQNSAGIKLSPNPVSNSLQLSFHSMQDKSFSVDISNALGQKIRSVRIQSDIGENKNSIDVSDLSNGVYFININDEKVRKPIKFIISH